MINEMYDDFKLCDDEVCSLYTRIDKMIDTVKAMDSLATDDTLVKLRSAKRSVMNTMMALILAKERIGCKS